MLNNGLETCSCPNTACKRNGKCEECLAFHRGALTRCQRDAKKQQKQREKKQQDKR